MSDQLRLLSQYATHRQFVESIAAQSYSLSGAAKELLESTTEISEGVLRDGDTFPACALVWNGDTFASGIYVGGRVVLTAAHVIAGIHPKMASIGVANIDDRFGSKDFKVASYVMPPFSALEWDVAALVLEAPVNATSAPAIGTEGDFNTVRNDNQSVTVCGFGWGWPAGHPEQLSSGVKRSMTVPMKTPPVTTTVSGKFFVAGDASETAPFHNICKFDSGAPAFVESGGGLILLGVASATVDLLAATAIGCGIKPLGIFARVDPGRDWILQTIKQHP